jgi:HK97 family phage prohead protease
MPRSYALRDWNDVERSFRVVASTPTPIKSSEWDPTAGEEDDEGRPMGAMVDYWEALEGWDFGRFNKNPLVYESHCTDNSDFAIGKGSEFKQSEDGGLEMKVMLAPGGVNKRTLELEPRIKEGYLRGVSVGWDYGDRTDEMRNGRMTRVYRNNKLTEVSLVPIPADEDGLVEAEQDPDAQRRERLGNAARTLAKQRRARMGTNARTDAAESDVERFDFFGTVGKYTRTQVGGIRVPARLTRTGILEYKRSDGTIRRELRLPEEVFNTDSLASLQGATVTDLSHHRGLLSLEDWKDATLGHTEAVRRDGKFVEADLMINDPVTVADVENGKLHDISCGYSCKLDASPGIWEGQPYDVIQRRIRYNHVAVLPKGRGRAGIDVAIRTDSNDADCVEKETPTMTRVIRIDGKNLDYGSDEHITHLENGFAATLAPLQTQVTELKTRCDTVEAERDVARSDAKKFLDELKDEKDGEKSKSRRRARSRQLRKAIRILASDDEDEDDAKMDALEDELDALSDRDLQLKVIRTDAKYADGNAVDGTPLDKKSDDYVSAIFDAVCSAGVTRADGVDSIVEAAEIVKRADVKGGDGDAAVNKARADMNKRRSEQWTKPLT